MTVWSDRVALQLDFLLQHSWMQSCLKRQNPTPKQTSIIFSAFLLAEFAAASLAAQLCRSLTYKEIPRHFYTNPVLIHWLLWSSTLTVGSIYKAVKSEIEAGSHSQSHSSLPCRGGLNTTWLLQNSEITSAPLLWGSQKDHMPLSDLSPGTCLPKERCHLWYIPPQTLLFWPS